jgi:anaerobic selenocysteine-containing dehydrogenase
MTVQQHHTYCAMCVSRCGVVATVDNGVLKSVNADPAHPNGCICVKGTAAPEIVYSPDRLQYPMKRTRPKGDRDPGWVRISWEEATDYIAARLLDVKSRYGAEAVVFGVGTGSGGAISDFHLWLQRLANAFGTPNLMTSIHICNWSRAYGSQYSYGVATPRPDYDNARCILLWGFNPHASWPTDAVRISRAKARGAKIIVIDPRRASMVDKADMWLRVRPGGDGILAMTMIHVLLEEKFYDEDFAREWTNGPFLVRQDTHQLLTEHDLNPAGQRETFHVWDERSNGLANYRADRGYAANGVTPALSGAYTVTLSEGKIVECRPAFALLRELANQYAPERTEEMTWVKAGDVRRAVRMVATEKPSCYFSWAGLEQHSDAAQINRAVCLFYALTGQFDSRGSNVLFAGTPTNPIIGQELLSKEQATRRLGRAERPLGAPSVPGRAQAYDVYRAILTGQPYPVKALVAFGSDPLVGNGDPLSGKAALEALDFYAHVDLFGNPSAAFADLLLPASTCWEHEGLMPSFDTAEDTKTWAQLRPAVVESMHECRSDLEIIFDLAKRLGLSEHFFGGDIGAAYDYHLAPSGLTVQQLRENRLGMRANARTRYQKYAEIDAQTGVARGFHTPTKKVEIYSTSFAKAGYPPLPLFPQVAVGAPTRTDHSNDYPLVLTFFRLVQFCDQQHRHIPRLRRPVPEPFLEIHPDAAKVAGIEDGEWVVLETAVGKVRVKAKFKDSLHPGVVATQYGWWQGCQELGLPSYDPFGPGGANANLLIPNQAIDPISGSVPHRSQRCRVRKEGVETAGEGA